MTDHILLVIFYGETMKDNKHIVTIDRVDYFIQRTFSNEVAIYISARPGIFVHISEYLESRGRIGLGIKDICAGLKDQDECFILAHLVFDDRNSESHVEIDGSEYVIDMTIDKAPAVFLSAVETFYNVKEYGSISRTVSPPENILLRPEYDIFDRIGQVVICANAQLNFD